MLASAVATKTTRARKGGAPRKAADGLNHVLYVRTNQELLDKLEDLRQQRSDETPGVVLSTADVARAILWEAVERVDGKEE